MMMMVLVAEVGLVDARMEALQTAVAAVVVVAALAAEA